MRARTNQLFDPFDDVSARTRALMKLCLAKTCRHFEHAAHQFFNTFFHSNGCLFIFAPAGAQTPAYFPDPDLRGTSRRRFRDGLTGDYWYQQHPPERHKTQVVRHSDYTSSAKLERTDFFRTCLKPHDYSFGVSLVFWEREQFLGCLTLLRSHLQGDYSAAELEILRAAYNSLLEKTISRLADSYSLEQEASALRQAVYLSGEATVVVRRPETIVAGSKQALRMLQSWGGNGAMTHKLPRTRISLPSSLRGWCERPADHMSLAHPKWIVNLTELHALNRGKQCSFILLRLSSVNFPSPQGDWLRLTHTERDLISGVIDGKTNREISLMRRTSISTVKNQMSHLIKKLKVRNRTTLAVLFRNVVMKGVTS